MGQESDYGFFFSTSMLVKLELLESHVAWQVRDTNYNKCDPMRCFLATIPNWDSNPM
jgi:hypothetical protein